MNKDQTGKEKETMTTAEKTLAAIKHQHLHAELFKAPFNLIGEKAEPKKFTPRPVWKQEQLFTMKGER
jgi:hypothetical protein